MGPPPAAGVAYGKRVSSPKTEAPWVVTLYQSARKPRAVDPFDMICTGTALDAHTVLTAAHCVEDLDGDVLTIGYGGSRLSRQRITAVTGIRSHPRYDDVQVFNDLALLRTRDRMRIAKFPKLATKSNARAARRSAARMTLYGWGLDQRGRLSQRMTKAVLRPRTKAAIRRWGSGFRPGKQLAAGALRASTRRYPGACEGDSGGPLVLPVRGRPVVVGVTSFGWGRCGTRSPTIFMSTGNYRRWIRTTASSLGAG